MILWFVKLFSSLRKAIAGRRYPHQMAWALAFGLLLGIVPHGNLLALALLIVVLSLKINHAMAGLTAVAATFVATRLDPYSHQVGDFVLAHPQLGEKAVAAWQLPLVPWTDLNNTVVMGSFLIGVGALVPVFLVSYPVFRFLAPADDAGADEVDQRPDPPSDLTNAQTAGIESSSVSKPSPHQVVLIDDRHRHVAPPHRSEPGERQPAPAVHRRDEPVDFVEIASASASAEPSDDEAPVSIRPIAVETRIDVIRMKDHRSVEQHDAHDAAADSTDAQPMDEALNYLLRQLRDSQQRKAA